MSADARTILIADDDDNVRESVAWTLKQQDFKLLFAATALETRQQVADHNPDLVILDGKFPDCADLSLLRWIKSSVPNTYVILLSASCEMFAGAFHEGVDDWIEKPFDRDNLQLRVEKAFRDRRKRQGPVTKTQ